MLKHIEEVSAKRGVDAVERCLFADGMARSAARRRGARRGGPQPPDVPPRVLGRVDLSPEERATRDAKRLMRLHYHTSLRLILEAPNDAAMICPPDPDLISPQPYKAQPFLPRLPSASTASKADGDTNRRPASMTESRSCPVLLPPLQPPAESGSGAGPAGTPPKAQGRVADGGGGHAEASAKRPHSKSKVMYTDKSLITEAVRRKNAVLGLSRHVSLPAIEVKTRKEPPRRWRAT